MSKPKEPKCCWLISNKVFAKADIKQMVSLLVSFVLTKSIIPISRFRVGCGAVGVDLPCHRVQL